MDRAWPVPAGDRLKDGQEQLSAGSRTSDCPLRGRNDTYATGMRSDEALGRLDAMLDAAGIDRRSPTVEEVSRTWSVLREFAKERAEDADPVERDGDMFLAEYGISPAWKDRPESFEVSITRQFMFSPDGQYDHMTQLSCTFSFEPTPENRVAGDATMWGGPNDKFFDRALQLPGFRLAEPPASLRTEYTKV
jgi:hypothetical protein